MRLVIMMAFVALGVLFAAAASAHADHWPPDLWDRLIRDQI
jgi:hypothetical protein